MFISPTTGIDLLKILEGTKIFGEKMLITDEIIGISQL